MVRELRPWETPLIEPLVREFHDEAKLGTTFSPERFWQGLDRFGADGLVIIGLFVQDALQGILIGCAAQQFMTDTINCQELVWYVRPEHRQSLDSVRLLAAFEAWAKTRGAYSVIMASFADSGDDNKLGGFYERRKYRRIETHYLKHL